MNIFIAHRFSTGKDENEIGVGDSPKRGYVFHGWRFLGLMGGAGLLALMTLSAPVHAQVQTNAAAPKAAPAGNIESGKKAFAKGNCTTCHGSDGQGAIAPRIGPPGRAYTDFVGYVRKPTGQMPPVSPQTISDSELTDIYAFLVSTGPAQPIISTAGANAQNGKKIFTSYGCYQCHGFEGQGSTQTGATRIGPPAISVSAFVSYVRHPTNQMPPYTTKAVSDSELADIFVFLQTIPMPPSAKGVPLLNQ